VGKELAGIRGRFKKSLDKAVQSYIESISFDRRLYKYDIEGSLAHVEMLAKQKIISQKDYRIISKGLKTIRQEIEEGKLKFKTELEDIHMNIESRLFELIGETAGKLHTARSRNDQIALDIRLYCRDSINILIDDLYGLNSQLIRCASNNIEVIMPGYTHLQQAQPVMFAHHLLAYFYMFYRDIQRFKDCFKRVNILPLGSGALAGVTYPVNRQYVAEKLGFLGVSENSIDAVSDRDFIIELEADCAITMMHLSRLAEEIVIWSTEEFGFVEIDDAFATSSSIMPQKKNPDVAELARGKTGRVFGHLMGMLTVMKGLPLAYNRDMQEDKEGLFDCIDTLQTSLTVISGLIATMKINRERIKSAMRGYILATDIADYLVGKGLPFREAHRIVSNLIGYALEQGKELCDLKLNEFRKFSGLFDSSVYAIDLASSVAARKSYGGTAPEQVKKSLENAKEIVKSYAAKKD